MKEIKKTVVSASIVAAMLCAGLAHAGTSHHAKEEVTSSKVVQTNAALRDLWVGHVFWVRNVALETLAGNKAGASAAEAEAVENAKQIAASIEPFYGKPASEKFFQLLAGHYTALKQYLDGTVAGNSQQQEAATKGMGDNAEKIAAFLSGANPNLKIDGLRSMLMAHGGHHIQQIQQLRDKQYAQEAKTWDAMKNHMYGVADGVTVAIAKQFPAKFK